jgi:transposase-like protein
MELHPTTINEWIRKYNRKGPNEHQSKVETKDEITRIKALQKEIEQLKKLLLKKGSGCPGWILTWK